MQVEVHSEETEEAIVVEAVFEDVSEWHRLARESVNERCLELTFDIVDDYHEDAELLI